MSRGAVVYEQQSARRHARHADGRGPMMSVDIPEMDFHRFSPRSAVTIHARAPSRWRRVIRDDHVSHETAADGSHPAMTQTVRYHGGSPGGRPGGG